MEIITSSNARPSRDWLNIVKSTQAKSKIRQYFKQMDRESNIIKGKDSLDKELKRLGYKLNEILRDDWLKAIAEKLSINSIDDLYASIGYGNVKLNQVISRLKDFYADYYKSKYGKEFKHKAVKEQKKRPRSSSGIRVRGVDNIKVRLAKCCSPVPGDEIVGYVTKGRGVSVHRADCPNIMLDDAEERLIDVEWDTEKRASYLAEIQVRAIDRSGLLADIATRINDMNISLVNINARTTKDRVVIINMTLEINDIDQLEDVMKRLRKIKHIIDAYRVTT